MSELAAGGLVVGCIICGWTVETLLLAPEWLEDQLRDFPLQLLHAIPILKEKMHVDKRKCKPSPLSCWA